MVDGSGNLGYSRETAGHIMTTSVPTVRLDSKISDVDKLLRKISGQMDSINYVYVLDSKDRLKGEISVRDLFSHPKTAKVKDMLPKDTVSVRPHTDQEHVALKAMKNGYKSIPVVDAQGKFLGAVTSKTIMKVIDNEAVEDIMKFGGVYRHGEVDDIFKLSIFQSLKHRLPWLLIGLLGGIAAAGIIESFEAVLESNLILAAYLPLLVYMADAVGTQMQAFMVREVAGTNKMHFVKYLFRQSSIVVLVSLIVSGILFGISYLMYGEAAVSFVLALALFAASISSLLSGLVVPYVFSKFKVDPANASGPIATIIQDVLSVLIYFMVANLML